MIGTIDLLNVPKPRELPKNASRADLEAALQESLVLYYAAMNTRLRDGSRLVDLAGCYLTRVGVIRALLLNHKEKKRTRK